MDIRETEGSRVVSMTSSPDRVWGNAFYPGKVMSVYGRPPPLICQKVFLCTIMTYYDFYCLQIDHWDLGVIVTIVSILFVSIKLY